MLAEGIVAGSATIRQVPRARPAVQLALEIGARHVADHEVGMRLAPVRGEVPAPTRAALDPETPGGLRPDGVIDIARRASATGPAPDRRTPAVRAQDLHRSWTRSGERTGLAPLRILST